MFSAEFFPTPPAVIKKMLKKIDSEAVHFLDPSAGKGDIAAAIEGDVWEDIYYEEYAEDESERGRSIHEARTSGYRHYRSDRNRRKCDVIESHPELVSLLRAKELRVVGFDWLTYPGISHYDAIVMNPPFSEGAAHLLHAWDFLYDGEIVCLLNQETIDNPYTAERQRLAPLSNITNLQKVRAGTNVTIGVAGDMVAALGLESKYVGGLILADKEQFDAVKAELAGEKVPA